MRVKFKGAWQQGTASYFLVSRQIVRSVWLIEILRIRFLHVIYKNLALGFFFNLYFLRFVNQSLLYLATFYTPLTFYF